MKFYLPLLLSLAAADVLPPIRGGASAVGQGGCPKITCVMFCQDGLQKDENGCDKCSCVRGSGKVATGTNSCKRDAHGCCSELGMAWCPEQNFCLSTRPGAVIPCQSWGNNPPATSASATAKPSAGAQPSFGAQTTSFQPAPASRLPQTAPAAPVAPTNLLAQRNTFLPAQTQNTNLAQTTIPLAQKQSNNFPPAQSNNNFPLAQSNNNFPPAQSNNFPPGPSNNNFPPAQSNNNFPPGPSNNNFPPAQSNNNFPPGPSNNNFPAQSNNNFPPAQSNGLSLGALSYPPGPSKAFPPGPYNNLLPTFSNFLPPQASNNFAAGQMFPGQNGLMGPPGASFQMNAGAPLSSLPPGGILSGQGAILPSSVAALGTSQCSEVMCLMYCPNGFQKDSRGCDVCSCAGESGPNPVFKLTFQPTNPPQEPPERFAGAPAIPFSLPPLTTPAPAAPIHSVPLANFDSNLQADALIATDRPTISLNPCLPAPGPCQPSEKCVATPMQCITQPCPQYVCVAAVGKTGGKKGKATSP